MDEEVGKTVGGLGMAGGASFSLLGAMELLKMGEIAVVMEKMGLMKCS